MNDLGNAFIVLEADDAKMGYRSGHSGEKEDKDFCLVTEKPDTDATMLRKLHYSENLHVQ